MGLGGNRLKLKPLEIRGSRVVQRRLWPRLLLLKKKIVYQFLRVYGRVLAMVGCSSILPFFVDSGSGLPRFGILTRKIEAV